MQGQNSARNWQASKQNIILMSTSLMQNENAVKETGCNRIIQLEFESLESAKASRTRRDSTEKFLHQYLGHKQLQQNIKTRLLTAAYFDFPNIHALFSSQEVSLQSNCLYLSSHNLGSTANLKRDICSILHTAILQPLC